MKCDCQPEEYIRRGKTKRVYKMQGSGKVSPPSPKAQAQGDTRVPTLTLFVRYGIGGNARPHPHRSVRHADCYTSLYDDCHGNAYAAADAGRFGQRRAGRALQRDGRG